MTVLLLAAFLGGLVTSISPCVLPVLPVVLTAGASDQPAVDGRQRRSRRPVWVVAGLVISFSASTLLGSVVLSALHLPQDLLRTVGIVVLIVIGVSLIVPAVAELIEAPFARLSRRSAGKPGANGLVLGLGLGLLYVPCAGPILATIAVIGATHEIGWQSVILTAVYGVGVGVPLLVFALAGDALTRRVAAMRGRASRLRTASGVVMLVFAVAITFNWTDALQRDVPSYVASIQNNVEGGSTVTGKLTELKKGGTPITERTTPAADGDLGPTCTEDGSVLQNCGTAPELTGLNGWLNTSGDAPLSLKGLRGKVVLIDFWTYSCINCQRALPHVEAWYSRYQKDGFVVIGVHTPEFAFEHVRSNIESQAAALGVKYPIAIDNDYATWNAYGNQYWPAEYLIDAQGHIRHVAFGEGGYDTTERLIRTLLHDANPSAQLGGNTDVPTADLNDVQTAETYLGYRYGQGQAQLHTSSGVTLAPDVATAYRFPARLDPDAFALDGQWTSRKEYLQAGAGAKLELSYQAGKAYLVLGGSGTVQVAIDGKATKTVKVSGPPTLYLLASATSAARHTMTLSVSPNVQAYSFTFG